jgi:hypothetical protein
VNRNHPSVLPVVAVADAENVFVAIIPVITDGDVPLGFLRDGFYFDVEHVFLFWAIAVGAL